MTLTLGSVFLLVAIILFILAGIGINSGRFSLLAIGLAFFAARFLVG